MYFVSVTRLRVRKWWYMPGFFRRNQPNLSQLINTKGFITGMELMDKGLVFWTVTVWQADADMKGFRNSEPHRKAMQKLPLWCDEASYVHWLSDAADMPSLAVIHQKMIDEGRITKVRYPSSNQVGMNYPPIKWTKTGQVFKPVNN